MENFEKKNTVKATNQVSEYVYTLGNTEGSPKILFLGNSITRHGKKTEIGWYGDWGMGASSIENDYVHICMKRILEINPNASFYMVQGAIWERSYKNCNLDEYFATAKNYNPDIMISFLSENVINEDFDEGTFLNNLHKLHKYLSGENTKILVVSNFFNNEQKTNALRKYAEKFGAVFVFVSDLILDKSNLADGFDHEGIKIHPGDKGMEMIAERIMEKLGLK